MVSRRKFKTICDGLKLGWLDDGERISVEGRLVASFDGRGWLCALRTVEGEDLDVERLAVHLHALFSLVVR